jgi:hypothetical protein
LWLLVALALMWGGGAEAGDHHGRQFLGWDAAALAAWESTSSPSTHEVILTSLPATAAIEWKEAVLVEREDAGRTG